MNHLMWGISDFFSMLWQIFIILCKAYLSIGFIVVIFIIVNDEIVKLYKEIDELKKNN